MAVNMTTIQAVVRDATPQAFAELTKTELGTYMAFPHEPARDPKGPRVYLETAQGDGATAMNSDGTGAIPVSAEGTYSQALGHWARYGQGFRIPLQEIEMLRQSGGDQLIGGFLEKRIERQLRNHIQSINTHLNSGAGLGAAGSAGIISIATWFDDSQTVMGVNRAVTTGYQCFTSENSGTPRAVSTALLDAVWLGYVETRGGNPMSAELWTSQTQFDKLAALTSGAGVPSYHMNASQADANGNGLSLQLGYVPGRYKGRPIVVVPGYPTGRIDIVDRTKIRIEHFRNLDGSPMVSELEVKDDQIAWEVVSSMQSVLENPWNGAASLQDLST